MSMIRRRTIQRHHLWSPRMYASATLIVLLARLLSSEAFLPQQVQPAFSKQQLQQRTYHTQTFASTTNPPPNPQTAKNPSQAFGHPLSPLTKKTNHHLIQTLKTLLFETAFPTTETNTNPQRAYARFYALETIARVPYFSYLSVLHLYETLGWWRKAQYLKIHFAESWNEMHHLLIMEELGGADVWSDRWLATHVAVVYYFVVVGMYMANPTWAYHLNQCVEEHAYATYDTYLTENKDMLQTMPAPKVAEEYYRDGDLYMFDEFQTDGCVPKRRPKIENLYDVFVAVRDDEMEHVKTMVSLQTDVELGEEEEEGCEVVDDGEVAVVMGDLKRNVV